MTLYSSVNSQSVTKTHVSVRNTTISKSHTIKFGIKNIEDKDNLKITNITLKNFDYHKLNKVEFKIKNIYSNDIVDTITLKKKTLKYFFKDISKNLYNTNNVISILPSENNKSLFYLDINNIQIYENKDIVMCYMVLHFKRKIDVMDLLNNICFTHISKN